MSPGDTPATPNGNGSARVTNGSAQAPVVTGEMTPGSAPAPADPRAAASIDAPPVQVAPGEVVHAALSVTNLRTEPASFALALSGLERGWYALSDRIGPLAPGERVDVPLDVTLPRGYPPCSILVSIEARLVPAGAPAHPARGALPGRAGTPFVSNGGNGRRLDDPRYAPGRHDLHVLVGDGATLAARLEPPDVVGGRRGRFSVVLRNRGSQSQQVRLDGLAPDPSVSLRFDPEAPLLLPGRQLEVAGRVRARRPLFGEGHRRPFAVQVQGRGTPTLADGSFTSRPWLPRWASKTLVIGLVVALWAAVAVVGIQALSTRLHRSAVQNSQVTSPTTAQKNKTNTHKSSQQGPTSSSKGTGTSGSGKTTAGKHTATSSKSSIPTHSVEVTGKVGGSSPGGVGVTLAPTSLVSPQALGATGTLASSVHTDRKHERTAENRGGGVTYGPSAVLTSSVRHRKGSHARSPGPRSTPLLVRASGTSRVPDGKVYGTDAAAAFFPGLDAAISPTLTTTTAPDGAFVFTGVPAPGTYLVSFTEPGFNTRKYIVQTNKGANVTLDTALSPGTGTLSGEVTGPNGPLGGVSITVSDGSVTITTVTPTTGADVGTWSVSGLNTPDTYLVSATAPGYGTQITTAALAASASLAGVDLKLTAGVGSISGTVTDATSSQPLGDVTVSATDGTVTATATTTTASPIGTYSLPDLTIPGTWTLSISGQGWITQTQEVKLDGNATVNASLTTSGANVIGVVSSGGSGLANVGLALANAHTTFKTLSESVAPVGGFDFGQIPPGQYVLSATKFGYTTQSASVDITAGQTQTVDLTLPFVGQSSAKTGTITGSVVNQFTAAPIATLPIELDGKSTGKVTNGTGVYTITDVAPGLHEITAFGSGKGFADAGVQVSVPEGATVTAPIIDLPSLASMSGIVLSGATGAPIPTPKVALLEDGETVGTPVKIASTHTGTYTITDIPAGNYVLKVTATGFDTSETSVSLSPGEALTDNVTLTEGPSFQAKTFFQTSGGTLQPQGGVCVVVSKTTAGHEVTPIVRLTTTQGGPVLFTALVAGQTYVAAFKLPTVTLKSKVTTCKALRTTQVSASAPTDVFIARPDNTDVYPAVLAPAHGTFSVVAQFPYVIAGSGNTGVGITKDCPIQASTPLKPTTAPPSPCPQVVTATATLPKVSITGTTGYATETNGTPGPPETATINLVAPKTPGSDVWSYPTTSKVPRFVSTSVTLVVSDAAGQFETLSKAIKLPGAGTSPAFDEILTAVPVPVTGTISPASGVSVTVNPDELSPTQKTGVANNLTSTDDISAVEGTAGALKWSDPATGVSGGSAQPGKYSLTLSKKGFATRTLSTVAIPLCPANGTCGTTVSNLVLAQQVTLVVSPNASTVPGTTLALPTVTLYLGTTAVATQKLVKSGANYSATFTNALTPTATASYHFAVTGPGIQTYTSATLVLSGATHGTLRATPTLVDDGWVKGTVSGVLVPTNAGSAGATEPLTGATVTATSGLCSTPTHPVTLSATTTGGRFLLVGTTGGLVPGTSYDLCVHKTGFTQTSTPLTAASGDNKVDFTLTATKITQQVQVKGVSTGVTVTVSATSPIGPTLTCTFTVGSTTAHTCTTVNAAKTGTSSLFTFELDPTTYSFTLSAPQYEATTVGPIPYAPGDHPLVKSYTLVQQVVTVSGKVTVSATGRRSTNAIRTLPLTLTSSISGTTSTTKTGKTGTYTFSNEPAGSYTITAGDTYTTITPISFSTGTTRKFVENFTVYAPPVPLKVKVTSLVTAASANGVTVTLTPSPNVGPAVTEKCGTHVLLEKGLGSVEATTAVGTAAHSTASFSNLVPDVYTVTFSGIGTKTDSPTPSSHKLLLCPSTASAPATTPSTPSFTLGFGEISATVTLETAPSTPPQVKMSGGTFKTTCTPSAPVATTASCSVHLLVDLTTTYAVTFSATGYTTSGPQTVKLSSTTPSKTLTVTLEPPGVAGVKVTLNATSTDHAVSTAIANATVTLTGSGRSYSATTNSTGVATFSTAVIPGRYKVLFTASGLSGTSSRQTEGTFKISSTSKSATVTLKTGTVHGTITLGGKTPPTTPVTVTVAVGTVRCATATVASGTTAQTYTCVLPPGTYTVKFSATGYTTKTAAGVVVTAGATATKNVTLP